MSTRDVPVPALSGSRSISPSISTVPSALDRSLCGASILLPSTAARIAAQTPPGEAVALILQSGCIDGAALADFCADTFGDPRVDLACFDAARCQVD